MFPELSQYDFFMYVHSECEDNYLHEGFLLTLGKKGQQSASVENLPIAWEINDANWQMCVLASLQFSIFWWAVFVRPRWILIHVLLKYLDFIKLKQVSQKYADAPQF